MVSLAGAGISGVAMVLTKKYQKKLSKVTKLTDIIMPALAIFERVVSKSLKNGKIDEEEFNSIQTFHLEMLNEFTGINHAENRKQVPIQKKFAGRDKRNKKKHRNKSLMVCLLCYFVCFFKNG